jgi:hypothetical protein
MSSSRFISTLRSKLSDKRVWPLVTLALISILFTLIPQLTFLGYILSVVLWAIYFTPLHILPSLLSRLVVSFLVLTCVQHIIGIIFWIFKWHLTLRWVLLVQGLILLALWLLSRKPSLPPFRLINRADLVAGAVGLIGPLVLIYSVTTGGGLAQQLLRFFTTGFDNSAHMSLTLTNYDNQGFVYGKFDTVKDKVIYEGLNAYPQGWHVNNALVMRSIFPEGLSPKTDLTKIMASYFALLLVWYFIIMYLFCLTAAAIARSVSHKENRYFELLVIAAFAIFIQLVTVTSFLRSGFGNFLPQLAYLLLIVMLGFEVYIQRDKKLTYLPTYLMLGFLICSGMALSWMLTAAVGYSIVLLTSYILYGKGLWPFILYIKRPRILLPLATLLFAPVVQVALWLLYGGVSDHLNTPGGIEPLNRSILIIVLIAVCLTYLLGKLKEVNQLFIGSLIGALSLSGLVYAYQLSSIQMENYYSIKLAHLAFVLLAVFGAGALAIYARDIARKQMFIGALFVMSLLIFVPQAVQANISSIGYLRGHLRKLSSYSSSQIIELLSKDSNTHANIVVFKELDYEEDVLTTNFLKMLSRINEPCQKGIFNSLIVGQRELLVSQIADCAKEENRPFTVIASNKNYDELSTYYKQHEPHVHVVLSN